MEGQTMFINWKTLCCKDSILPKFLYRLNVIPNKFQKAFFFLSGVSKLILKFIWKYKGPRIMKATAMEKDSNVEGLSPT